jgi:hypothetical protein
MITQKQMEENFDKLEPPGFPSIREIIEYAESGEDDRNALEYEKAYIALIEQVKDKPHYCQVAFLMEHMEELRDMVSLFSSARDMYLYDEGDFGNEVLANLMIYRYENHISILDDEYCKLTKDYVKSIEDRLYAKIEDEDNRKRREEYKLRKQWEAEHPEEAQKSFEQELRKIKDWAKKADKDADELFKRYSFEELLYHKSGK